MAEASNTEGTAGGGSDANSLVLTATSSLSSTSSSSDLDTESTTSFFLERSNTLGSLIGILGDADMIAGYDQSSSRRCSGVNPGSCYAGETASSQSVSFSHTSRMCGRAKLWSLLLCGSCRGFCDTDQGRRRGFCFVNTGNSSIGSSATAPPPSSLGHFLVAERDAERSCNDARVYINIMYEESAGTGHGLGETAINPLFNVNSSPATAQTTDTMISKECRETHILDEPFTQTQPKPYRGSWFYAFPACR
eukprot:c21424_g1_i2 orf=351-1100(-)